MASTRSIFVRHLFGGGWATDFGPTVDILYDQSGLLVLPFLIDAENVFYELDGGPHKIGGTTTLNATSVGASSIITGCYDFWRQGTNGVPTRRRVIHADTRILGDNSDFVFSNLATGLTSGAVPSYSTFDDFLILSSDSTTDVPRSWDQTTFQNLAGSPPRFSFSVKHQNRLWVAGIYTTPSRLHYSGNLDPEDWTGGTSGNLDIDPNDGDMITGLASFRNELWVFKGPYKGSIHRITGATPSTFARTTFVHGIGACWHNAIFPIGTAGTGSDLGFVSQFGAVHSINATETFGDYNEMQLSRPIQSWIQNHLNFNRLRYIWAVNYPVGGFVLFGVSVDSSSTNNACLLMDYRFNPVRWAYLPALDAVSIGLFTESNNVKRLYIGGNDGYVRRTFVANRSIDTSTAIAAKVTTPYCNYGQPIYTKTLSQAAVGIAPKGNYNMTFGWQADTLTQQTATVSQGGGDVLGAADANQFTLGTSVLAGSQFADRFIEEVTGEGRSFQYQITNSGNNEDMELHSITTAIKIGAVSTENS